MLLPAQVSLTLEPMDMRVGIDGLSSRAQHALGASPYDTRLKQNQRTRSTPGRLDPQRPQRAAFGLKGMTGNAQVDRFVRKRQLRNISNKGQEATIVVVRHLHRVDQALV